MNKAQIAKRKKQIQEEHINLWGKEIKTIVKGYKGEENNEKLSTEDIEILVDDIRDRIYLQEGHVTKEKYLDHYGLK